jgi:adenylate cyclase
MNHPAAAEGSLILLASPNLQPWPPLQAALTERGYRLCQVSQATELLQGAQALRPDGILLAAEGWPESSFDLCQQLIAQAQPEVLPIVLIGQQADAQDCVWAFEAGAADYLREPFWPQEGVARLRHALARARHQHHLQVQLQRAASVSGSSLLTDLQRVLRQQTLRLRSQNEQLQREVREREQAEAALRREQQKSEQLLLNILPKAVVEQLKQLEGSLAERFDEVTILFADIVNFTPLAAKVSPLELVNWLNQIFSTFDRLTEQFGLEKIKTIGDAYMVVGGLPLPQPDSAATVMEMAIAMQNATKQFPRQDGQPLQLRIGLHTGTVVAGVIGIRKFSYDLWGDAVNLASRMEAQGIPGKIQVTEATYQRLQDRYCFEKTQPVLVKGLGYMNAYHWVGRKF